jgi:hypothetical protein
MSSLSRRRSIPDDALLSAHVVVASGLFGGGVGLFVWPAVRGADSESPTAFIVLFAVVFTAWTSLRRKFGSKPGRMIAALGLSDVAARPVWPDGDDETSSFAVWFFASVSWFVWTGVAASGVGTAMVRSGFEPWEAIRPNRDAPVDPFEIEGFDRAAWSLFMTWSTLVVVDLTLRAIHVVRRRRPAVVPDPSPPA